MATDTVYVRAVLFQGETPVKIMTGSPDQLNANLSGGGQEFRIVDNTVLTTTGLTRTSLGQDNRLESR